MLPKQGEVVLKVENLKMHFPLYEGLVFRRQTGLVKALDGVSFELKQGETLGLVGESGCGKSTLAKTIMRLYDPTAGRIEVCGQNITRLGPAELRASRLHFQMIFQDPYASLNPRMTVFDIIAEPLRTHSLVATRRDLEKEIGSLMEKVGLPQRFAHKYPHEFSGGQRQRIAVARALAIRPKVVLCDEPVSALDVSVQAQILNLLVDLQKEMQLSYLFIAHDISAVRYLSSRIAVMYLGKIVETAATEELLNQPQHPYTKALLSAVPVADPQKERSRQRTLLRGDPPSPLHPPQGCSFHTRCPQAVSLCAQVAPSLQEAKPQHAASCILL